MYMPIPTCTCHVCCSCEAMRTARYNHNLLFVIRFLTGLNEEFSVVESQILLLDPLPSLNKIFSMVIQHERQIIYHVSVNDDYKVLVNSTENRRSSFRNNKTSSKFGQRVCTFCDKSGHTVDTYYRKHGIPPHLQKKSSNYEAHNAVAESSAPPTLTHEQYNILMSLLHASSIGKQSTALIR